MGEEDRVKVTIYGREYTISGGDSRERVIAAARHADEAMNKISEGLGGGSLTNVAVMAAMNIAGEYLGAVESQVGAENERDSFKKDIAHYQQLWEEAKKSYIQYKEDAKEAQKEKDEVQSKLSQRAIENDTLMKSGITKDEKIAELTDRVQSLTQRLKAREEGQAGSQEQIRKLEDTYKELEGNYFELQMENTKLKSENAKLREGQQQMSFV
jgi:cell division protein ZapA